MFPDRTRSDLEDALSVALQPSACGRHLVRHVKASDPFFYLGDTAWELFHRLDDEEVRLYLQNRADKGFNSVMVVIMAEHNGLDYPNRDGHFPFLPAPTSKPGDYVPDVYKPNPPYFDNIDRVIRQAISLGITITLVPTWGRYVNGGFYKEPIIFDEKNAYSVGRFLGERYPFHPFVLGGDSVRYWNPSTLEFMKAGKSTKGLEIIDYGPVWEAMAKGLREGESSIIARLGVKADNYETLITYHSCQCWFVDYPEATASAQFPEAEWLNLDCVQTGHYNGRPPPVDGSTQGGQVGGGGEELRLWNGSGSYEPIRKMYKTLRPNGKPRPVIDLEPHYEATHHWFDYDKQIWTADDIRSGAWQAIFAGSCGYTYGCNSIWQMHNSDSVTHPPIAMPTTAYTNWYLELDLAGAFYAAALRRFFLSLPDYFSRRPDSTFILSETNESIDGKNVLDTLIQGLKADSWAMVHLPYGGTVKVDIVKALGQGEKTYRAWWVDTRTGGRASIDKGDRKQLEGEAEFQSPSEGSIKNDWVLLLETYSK